MNRRKKFKKQKQKEKKKKKKKKERKKERKIQTTRIRYLHNQIHMSLRKV